MNEDNFKESKPNTQKNGTGDGIAIIVVAIIIAAIVGTSPNSDNSVQPNKPQAAQTTDAQHVEQGAFQIDSIAQQLFGTKQR